MITRNDIDLVSRLASATLGSPDVREADRLHKEAHGRLMAACQRGEPAETLDRLEAEADRLKARKWAVKVLAVAKARRIDGRLLSAVAAGDYRQAEDGGPWTAPGPPNLTRWEYRGLADMTDLSDFA